MTDGRVLAALRSPRHALAEVWPDLPPVPGLYAIYGDDQAWQQLALVTSADGPLYVGKAETSLVARDLRTHFGDGKTGSSTVRRSFASLLRDDLDLTAIPRNRARPDASANYALSDADDVKLTAWMRARLSIAVWPSDGGHPLGEVEAAVLGAWNPPLNLAKVRHADRARLSAARKAMADEARAWEPPG